MVKLEFDQHIIDSCASRAMRGSYQSDKNSWTFLYHFIIHGCSYIDIFLTYMKNKCLTIYDDAQKSLVSWSSTHAPIKVSEEQEKEASVE